MLVDVGGGKEYSSLNMPTMIYSLVDLGEQMVRAKQKNEDDGSMRVIIRSLDRQQVVRFCACSKADQERNREQVKVPRCSVRDEHEPNNGLFSCVCSGCSENILDN